MKFGINQSISQTITQLSCIQLEYPSSRLWNFWWIKTYTTFKVSLKITYLKLNWNLPGVNELSQCLNQQWFIINEKPWNNIQYTYQLYQNSDVLSHSNWSRTNHLQGLSYSDLTRNTHCICFTLAAENFGDAEIADLDLLSSFVQQNILRLEIPM